MICNYLVTEREVGVFVYFYLAIVIVKKNRDAENAGWKMNTFYFVTSKCFLLQLQCSDMKAFLYNIGVTLQ